MIHATKAADVRDPSEVRREVSVAVFERLESRLLLSADVGALDLSTIVAAPQLNATPCITNTTPSGLTPAKVRHAYGFDQISFTSMYGQQIVGDGSGQTIAIVNAYDNPNIASDLSVFDATFGLSDYDSKGQFVLTKVKMSSNVAVDAGWAMEIALDVEWAHAMAPKAHILLVEAASASFSSLLSAVDYAARQPNVAAVSMSWGAGEFSSESSFDYHFKTPAGHVGGGVAFVAASGDDGKGGLYPAMSPNVISVGGTQISVDSSGNYRGEVAWSGSGGGISLSEAKPSYQASVRQSSTRRTGPDVAYDGSPSSGFAVYDTVAYSGRTGWWQVGGTSAGAPQWAALVAIADQGRAAAGKTALDGLTQMMPALYGLPSADFHDITSGSNGYAAATGYDLVTGRGSPIAGLVVRDLIGTVTRASISTSFASPFTSRKAAPSFTGPRAGPHADVAAPVWTVQADDSALASTPLVSNVTISVATAQPTAPHDADAGTFASDARAAAADTAAHTSVAAPSVLDIGIDVLASARPLNLLAA